MDSPDVSWKKRALAAEGKLAGYRRLREVAERVLAEGREESARTLSPELDGSMDELAGELFVLGEVDKPPSFFDQKIGNLSVRCVANLGCMSKLEGNPDGTAVITVDAGSPDAIKLIGFLFQLVQYADLAAVQTGSEVSAVSPTWLNERAPAIAVLLLSAGFLHPLLPVSAEDVASLAE